MRPDLCEERSVSDVTWLDFEWTTATDWSKNLNLVFSHTFVQLCIHTSILLSNG